jgi:hypothetical protein
MELEPISTVESFPRYLDLLEIPQEYRSESLLKFCISNFIFIHEMKSIILLYKSFIKEGETSDSAIKKLKMLLPSSKIFTNTLIHGLSMKDSNMVRSSITKLFLHGYLLDDILLSLEKSISLFPSTDPTIRFRLLQFTMLGWIYIQQGKEHWLDTMDIVEEVMRDKV